MYIFAFFWNQLCSHLPRTLHLYWNNRTIRTKNINNLRRNILNKFFVLFNVNVISIIRRIVVVSIFFLIFLIFIPSFSLSTIVKHFSFFLFNFFCSYLYVLRCLYFAYLYVYFRRIQHWDHHHQHIQQVNSLHIHSHHHPIINWCPVRFRLVFSCVSKHFFRISKHFSFGVWFQNKRKQKWHKPSGNGNAMKCIWKETERNAMCSLSHFTSISCYCLYCYYYHFICIHIIPSTPNIATHII